MRADTINDMSTDSTEHLLPSVRKWLSAHRNGGQHRLPPEREMAEQFCISRAQMRKALAVLEGEGQIRRHVGRGTFIVSDAAPTTLAGEEIAARTSPLAAMQARRVVEPELCRLAALHATSAQIEELRTLCTRMRASATWEEYAGLDWRLHNVIAEATGNVLLVEIQELLNGVRRYVVWGHLVKRPAGPAEDYHSFAEHERIVAAIAARDGKGAMAAMLAHLQETHRQMFEGLDDA
ncbi:FadR/GntR family transcriptional regulator [Sphingomonas corticis]|uniref:FadR family transcriptional regulator n=1 Tax=Sphingomonas corticis TaxID=2722791 RepID=A0ABX1CRM7_9SPHN|nr:FCD domain-containing protein [Sphingomonas corticis]NJR80610.1 FadR family transcriptional regulator [Sphingomonas corticis]